MDSQPDGSAYLDANGFELYSAVPVASLPGEFLEGIAGSVPDSNRFATLICIGNAGRGMWDALMASGPDREHPVNVFTSRVIGEFVNRFLPGGETISLFPSTTRVFPVQKLGEWLGWVHPSPVGVGIHAKYGLWHAYRSVLLTTISLPETPREYPPSPCESCRDKPCISVCPAGAVKDSVHRMDTFDVTSCALFRLRENSICRDKCLSRLSCPVGREYKYPMAQMKHAYGASLPKMAAYLARQSASH